LSIVLRNPKPLQLTVSVNKMLFGPAFMKISFIPITLLMVIWFSACGNSVSQPSANLPSANAFRPRSESTDIGVKNDVDKFAAEASGKVGVAALDLETGEYFSMNDDGHYPMQSVYKLPISLAAIRMYEKERLNIEENVTVGKDDLVGPKLHSPIRDKFPNGTEMSARELIRYAMEESDGTASDVLLRLVGGPENVQAYLTTIGISDMKVLNTENEMAANWQTQYENWSTPGAAVALLQALYEGRALSSETGRELILQMMTNSTPGPGRIRGRLEDARVAHKTGTSGTQNGVTAATNDIGLVTLPNGKHMAIAVFVTDSTADEKTREATIAKITKVLFNHWKR
jgi:beta-lactamase class A